MAALCFSGIGTEWRIDTAAPLAASLRALIAAEVARFDRTWSRFRPDSLVAEIDAAASGGVFRFPAEAAPLFDLYDRLHAATDGAVDPLIGADLERLGYDRDYTLRPTGGPPARRPDWRQDVRRGGTVLQTSGPVVLDVGAAGKGLLVDRLAALLREAGIETFVIDGSGDLLHAGDEPLRVGLRRPYAPDRVVGVATIANEALCASGVDRRSWGDGLHHVVDGRTGVPTRDVVATWAIADDAMTADGFATALFFVPHKRLDTEGIAASVRMFADGSLEASGGFVGELFD